ncbi:hypothetical protein LB503_007140 [Fusarium chuoi]|nr:hypothetical protein LB503_007140 [Fusarium chuoi]
MFISEFFLVWKSLIPIMKSLHRIHLSLLAPKQCYFDVKTADDLLNQIELEFLVDVVAKDMTPVYSRAVMAPASNATTNHESYPRADLSKHNLKTLLA